MKSRIKKIMSALRAGRENSKGKKRYFCPCCGEKNEFSSFGISNRENALCPVCKSLERHRFLYYIYNIFIFSQKNNVKVLHMAPEKCLYDLFKTKENVELEIKGRHDPCIVQRAVVVVEAMMALGILDMMME